MLTQRTHAVADQLGGRRSTGRGGPLPGEEDRPENAPLAAGCRRVRQARLEHPDEVAQHLSEFSVVEPHPGHAVARTVTQRVDVPPGEVAVEVAEEPGNE